MRHPQLLVYEGDGRLAELFRPIAQAKEHRWALREPRQLDECLEMLRRGGPGVLLIKVGRDLERELTLVEQVGWLFPETSTVVVGDNDHTALAGLAWDLGAYSVLVPPPSRERLLEIVLRAMTTDGGQLSSSRQADG
jgi:DNA-binding NtrC family response regulator